MRICEFEIRISLQVISYRGDEPVILGLVHIATGPIFAAIVAGTIAFARRAMPTRTSRAAR